MQTRAPSIRKVTISLPLHLIEFADRQAERLRISRSEIIGRALAQAKAAEAERLAVEGYRFYSQEAGEFAEASARSFAEDGRSGRSAEVQSGAEVGVGSSQVTR